MTTTARPCLSCDRPAATPDDYVTVPDAEAGRLCWRIFTGDVCRGPYVDWRARALAAETTVIELYEAIEGVCAGLTRMLDRQYAKLTEPETPR